MKGEGQIHSIMFKCFGKISEREEKSRHEIVQLVVTFFSPIKELNGILLVRSEKYVGHEMLWPPGRFLARRMWS